MDSADAMDVVVFNALQTLNHLPLHQLTYETPCPYDVCPFDLLPDGTGAYKMLESACRLQCLLDSATLLVGLPS
jgi:hypothetical protein